MIGVKNLSLIVTIITGILLPFSIFISLVFFLIDLMIFLFSALTTKICIFSIKQKILNDEYKNRFKDS